MPDEPVSSSHVHRIRLGGPWHFEPLVGGELDDQMQWRDDFEQPLPPSGTMKIPGDWGETLGQAFRGRVAFTRRFGRPLNLESSCQLYLAVHKVDARAQLWLNGDPLGEIPWGQFTARFELPLPLSPRNELRVLIDCPAMSSQLAQRLRPPGRATHPGGLIGEVALEIYEE